MGFFAYFRENSKNFLLNIIIFQNVFLIHIVISTKSNGQIKNFPCYLIIIKVGILFFGKTLRFYRERDAHFPI